MPIPILPPKETRAIADTTASLRASLETKVQELSDMPADKLIATVTKSAVEIGLKIILVLTIYIVGRWLIKYVLRIQKKLMDRRNADISLRVFLNNLTQITLMLVLIIIIISILGIDTTSFVALFASAGIAIGMALSGTLQNFAGGVMILAIKPFKVGDFIEAQGQSGSVKEIRLFHTILNTPDNKTIIIPNGGISTGIINNYSHESNRRIEWTFGIAYGQDYDQAKALLSRLIEKESRILRDPAWLIALKTLNSSSVDIVVRAWAPSEEYWNVYFSINEQVYKSFGQAGINIPYPQLDVHIVDAPAGEKTR